MEIGEDVRLGMLDLIRACAYILGYKAAIWVST